MTRVSAIVPSWNGRELLPGCLSALAAQRGEVDLDVVVWDNGSTDGSAELARQVLAELGVTHRVLTSPSNVGFAAGCNGAIAASDAELVLLVNQDVVLDEDYAALLARLLEERPDAASAQGILLRADGVTVDSLGQYPSYGRRCVERGAGRPLPASLGPEPYETFSVCAAAAMYRRDALEAVATERGPFDDSFFAYYEDLDLGWRLRRLGHVAYVVPRARGRHLRGGSAAGSAAGPGGGRMLARLAPELRRRVLRNRWLVVLGNETPLGLVAHLPGVLGWEALLLGFLALRDPRSLAAHVRGFGALVAEGVARRRRLRTVAPRRPLLPTIAIVITKLELGGAQQVALAVAAALAATRARVIFVTGVEGPLRAECEAIGGLRRYFLPDLVREVSPLADLRAWRELVRIFRRERVDLVHTHSSKAGVLGRLAARRAGVRHVVHTVHGFAFNDFQRLPARVSFLLAERWAGRATSRWVAVSRENVERGVRARVLERDRTVLIRAGIDLERFRQARVERKAMRAALGIPVGARVVGTVACLKPQKAPLHFVAVAARVCRELPDALFVLVGDGELRDRVESEIRSLHLSERLLLLGWRDDVADLMHAFDLFLLTSLWEGLPMVLPQARAAELAIVATRVNGNPEAVVHGHNGRLRDPGDVDGMARDCIELLSNDDERRRLASNADQGLAEFSAAAMVAGHQALYESLLGGTLRGRS